MKQHQVNLYQVCSNYIPGTKNGPAPWVTFYIDLYTENMKSLDIWYVASPSGPLPILFQLCHRGQKWPLPRITFCIGLYREKDETIFFYETTMPRALIFGMKHHLVNLPGWEAQSVTCLATDASLTADPGVAISTLTRSHTFVDIDHEIISTSFSSLPLNRS